MDPATRGSVLWWGRFDPHYSRNRILRQLLRELGFDIVDFHPRISIGGALQATMGRLPVPALVWVPCFRQRDLAAARRWSAAHAVPLLADPLISAYDKQINERARIAPASWRARRLLAWERARLGAADAVLADTAAHAAYFRDTLGLAANGLHVVQLGAEESLFVPTPLPPTDGALEVLFYGSFIGLQAPRVIVEAALGYRGPPVRWTLLGDGPLRAACAAAAGGSVDFEAPLPYAQLPARIARAHLLLGVFGGSGKAGRVVPNKVLQSMACARPVITRDGEAYPAAVRADREHGLYWVAPEDPAALAAAVAGFATDRAALELAATRAIESYRRWFALDRVRSQLAAALAALGLRPG